MNNPLRQSTAVTVKLGPFMDNTGELLASLTIAQPNILLSKNGGAFAQSHNAAGAAYDAHGYYSIPLDAVDTAALGLLRVMIDKSDGNALAVHRDFAVLAANVYDALVGEPSAAVLATNAAQIGGQTATASAPITVHANLGTSQPVNFNGTGAAALVQSNTMAWNGESLPSIGTSTLSTADVQAALANYGAAKTSDIPSTVVLAAAQPNYAPAKPGDAMTLTAAYDAAKTAAQPSDIPAATAIADAVLARNVAQAEALAPQTSLATAILATTAKANTSANPGYLTIYRTDRVTEHARIPVSTDHNADPINGVG
jgi:hypothetical protein